VLLESIVSIALITIIMTALTALFVTSMKVTNHQRASQNAIRIATDVIDQARGLGASNLPVSWPSQTINGVQFTITPTQQPCSMDSSGTCQPDPAGTYVRVDLAIGWTGQECPSTGCTYNTSVVLSALPDPVFLSSATTSASPSPSPSSPPSGNLALGQPGNQRTALNTPGSLQLAYACAATPCTLTALGLPTGLVMNASGAVSGVPTQPGTYAVSVTLTDAGSKSVKQTFRWYVLSFSGLPDVTLTGNGSGKCQSSTLPTLTSYVQGASGAQTYALAVTPGTPTLVLQSGATLGLAGGNLCGSSIVQTATVTVTDAGDGAPSVSVAASFKVVVKP
jgi:type II secretory pathway pseudopilin PulG